MTRVSARLCAGLLMAVALQGPALEGPALAQPSPPEASPAPEAAFPEANPASPAPFVESLPKTVAGVPGTWDLSRDGSTRRCVLTLTAQSTDAGRRLSFPAGCRRALPILNGIAGWLFADGAVRLVDKDVRPILLFTVRADARSLMARNEAGESYSLVPLQIAAAGPAMAPVPVPVPSAGSAASAPPNAEATGERPAPGTYALDRYREQDVCRIELLPGEPGLVRILDGCRDSGLATFDPVSWRQAPDRLTITARRGHTVTLVPAGDDRWRREPEIGTTFVLRRVEPGRSP